MTHPHFPTSVTRSGNDHPWFFTISNWPFRSGLGRVQIQLLYGVYVEVYYPMPLSDGITKPTRYDHLENAEHF